MKFKNKNTGAIVETSLKTVEGMYKNNPKYEEVKTSNTGVKEPTIEEIKAKLTELGIEYPNNANKKTLLALLPQKNTETAE